MVASAGVVAGASALLDWAEPEIKHAGHKTVRVKAALAGPAFCTARETQAIEESLWGTSGGLILKATIMEKQLP